jgi:hypothetical protein
LRRAASPTFAVIDRASPADGFWWKGVGPLPDKIRRKLPSIPAPPRRLSQIDRNRHFVSDFRDRMSVEPCVRERRTQGFPTPAWTQAADNAILLA